MVNQVNMPCFQASEGPSLHPRALCGLETLTERAVRNIIPDKVQEASNLKTSTRWTSATSKIVNMDPVQVRVIVVQPPKVELGDSSAIRAEKDRSNRRNRCGSRAA